MILSQESDWDRGLTGWRLPSAGAGDLKVRPDKLLVKIDRMTLANGAPIALMTNYLLLEIVRGHGEGSLPERTARMRYSLSRSTGW